MKENQYTIEDLCELTGYSRRTIRYYVHEGLIDPPSGRGRGGFYYDSHMNRLLEIRSLQDKGMKLASIRGLLDRKEGEPEIALEREVWIRCPVARGVEIHFTRQQGEKKRIQLAEIIRAARSILEEGDNGDG
jgi:DNA-binding transcriptional MerR regulator